jgi:membrane protease YdiL (CAAX protease family)
VEETVRLRSYLEWSSRGKSGLLRYLSGSVLIFLIFFLLGGIGLIPIAIRFPRYSDSVVGANAAILSTFVIPFFCIPLVVWLVNRRPFWSVAMPTAKIDLRGLLIGFGLSLVVGSLTVAVCGVAGVLHLEVVGIDWGVWLPLALIGLVGVFIQASSEEMFFRGYLTQFARRFTANPYVFLAIPAVLFALPHIANVAALGGGLVAALPYLVEGLVYGWVAYRTGSLWMSVGIHWCNNLTGLVLVGMRGDVLKTVAPVQFDLPGLWASTLIILAEALVLVSVVYLLTRPRFLSLAQDSAA